MKIRDPFQWACYFAILISGSSSLAASPKSLIEINEIEVSETTFKFRAEALDRAKRALVIECTRGCRANAAYNEALIDYPFAAFRIGDDSPILFVLSTTGSAENLRAYLLGPSSISKVLEIGFRELRSIGYSNGKESLTVADADSEKRYEWNGQHFSVKASNKK